MSRYSSLVALLRWIFASNPPQPTRLIPRWLFLRALGLIYFSAFFSLLFQVCGLIGPNGLLPAGDYLRSATQYAGAWRWWLAPTVFWLASGSRALVLVCWVGIVVSLLLVLNFWPRAMILACLIGFVSFTSVLQAFSSYQSDGMLIEAGFLCVFFAPPGLRPGWGQRHQASRAIQFLLQWMLFRIYFESGLGKIISGEPEWRKLTAMSEYYQNGPLPTWLAWYAQHLPGWFHIATSGFTLLLELVLIWMIFLPRRFRVLLFCIVTPWQIGIILTSNYGFLNYLVLVLGILLVDDKFLIWLLSPLRRIAKAGAFDSPAPVPDVPATPAKQPSWLGRVIPPARAAFAALVLTWVFYAATAQFVWIVLPHLSWLPIRPVTALEPFRITPKYGLFVVMTRGRYEIEFQGSNDGRTWTAYPFRYKPQELNQASRIFAPYQARFDWTLWFASIDNWQQNLFVVNTEERLLTNTPAVLALFAGNPFASGPPEHVRAVVLQYWFADSEQRRQGLWWRREFLGLYAPQIVQESNGRFQIIAMPPPGGKRLQLRQPPWLAANLPGPEDNPQ